MEIEHFSHKHKLTLHELTQEIELFCKGCHDLISDSAYACGDCQFWLHKSCAELPDEIQHPLHIFHPLTLLAAPEYPCFICTKCRNISGGFVFNCSWCQFNLDVKCALLMDQTLEGGHRQDTIYHFSHKHELNLCNFGNHSPLTFCCCCNLNINNCSAYCCIDCRFFIHEFCLSIPQEVRHPCHQQHPLFTYAMVDNESRICNVCDELVEGISLCCMDCEFYAHVACRYPFTRTLTHKCHDHNLVYFPRNNALFQSFKCNKCHGYCRDSFYRCNEGNWNVNLECIPLPLVVKHKCHDLHPLVLVNSIRDNNCEVCKMGRNPDDHFFYCEECGCLTHIECVICEDDTSLETLSYMDDKAEQYNDSEDKKLMEDDENAGCRCKRKSRKVKVLAIVDHMTVGQLYLPLALRLKLCLRLFNRDSLYK